MVIILSAIAGGAIAASHEMVVSVIRQQRATSASLRAEHHDAEPWLEVEFSSGDIPRFAVLFTVVRIGPGEHRYASMVWGQGHIVKAIQPARDHYGHDVRGREAGNRLVVELVAPHHDILSCPSAIVPGIHQNPAIIVFRHTFVLILRIAVRLVRIQPEARGIRIIERILTNAHAPALGDIKHWSRLVPREHLDIRRRGHNYAHHVRHVLEDVAILHGNSQFRGDPRKIKEIEITRLASRLLTVVASRAV